MTAYTLVAFGILALILGFIGQCASITESTTVNPDVCIWEVDDLTYTFSQGKTITPTTRCIGCTCTRGGTYIITCEKCDNLDDPPNPNCELVSKTNLTYPQCCPYYVCD
ncbi:unnamed protein product [Gordionus sp. m RMFG-2023]|uniref:uncharacterized protein LOC135931841 n=1 Tax=Gordionus sp. m RMFG-2023 TaxID=3053472 RepID=UPI0030E455D8